MSVYRPGPFLWVLEELYNRFYIYIYIYNLFIYVLYIKKYSTLVVLVSCKDVKDHYKKTIKGFGTLF